jgi:hypothetical protein
MKAWPVSSVVCSYLWRIFGIRVLPVVMACTITADAVLIYVLSLFSSLSAVISTFNSLALDFSIAISISCRVYCYSYLILCSVVDSIVYLICLRICVVLIHYTPMRGLFAYLLSYKLSRLCQLLLCPLALSPML